MEYTFPDSKRKIEMERVSFTALSLLRASYESSYPDKPQVPMLEIDGVQEPNPADEKYQEALAEWDRSVSRAVWAATQLLYAKKLKEIDLEAVNALVSDLAEVGVDLKQQVRDRFAEYHVPFEDKYMDAYLYLWCICVTDSSESNLFNIEMTRGSQPTQEAVQRATFSFQGKI